MMVVAREAMARIAVAQGYDEDATRRSEQMGAVERDPPPAPPSSSGRGDVPELPVRDFADIHLAEAVTGGGCPVCTARARVEAGYLGTLLFEGVTDPVTREDLRRARGLCRRHSHSLAQTDRESGSSLGAAILLEAILGWRLAELRKAAGSSGRKRRAGLEQAARPPTCPVCRVSADAAERARGEILRWSNDPHWSSALAKAGFCLDDLLFVWTAAPDDAGFSRVAAAQIERIDEIRSLTGQFAYHSSYDRRHLITPEEEAAVGRADHLLAGDPRPKNPRGRGHRR